MSKIYGNMDVRNRAKQFAPFAALKGQEMELAKQLKPFEERIVLAEDEAERINQVLLSVDRGDEVKVTYYTNDIYTTIIGTVEKIFIHEGGMQIKGNKISFKDIYRIEILGL